MVVIGFFFITWLLIVIIAFGARPVRTSFRPERVLFRPGGVNHQDYLCGVQSYASAQSLDFLAMTKNPHFPNRKPVVSHPEFPDGNELIDDAKEKFRKRSINNEK